jgi:hypothetical protein
MTNTTETSEPKGFVLGDTTYNRLKWFVQIVLPSIATLYFSLGNVWGFGYIEQVLGTLAALGTFLGVVLGISSVTYNNSNLKYSGMIEVFDPPETDKKTYSITFDGDVDDIDQQEEVTFKVFKR